MGGPFEMKRSPNAVLSQAEVDTLLRLRRGRVKVIRREHEDLLLSMRLVRVTEGGRLKLTEDGQRRLREKLPTAAESNPFAPAAIRKNPFDLPTND
jgi:hypothetical protein